MQVKNLEELCGKGQGGNEQTLYNGDPKPRDSDS